MSKSLLSLVLASASLTVAAHKAHADDVDVSAYEFVDVVETADGSIWKGVIVEQVPNQTYKVATADGSLHVLKAGDVLKVTRERNKGYRRGGTPRTQNVTLAPSGAAAATTPPAQTATGTEGAAAATTGDPVTGDPADPNGGAPAPSDNGVHANFEPRGIGRYAKTGLRFQGELTSVSPMGDLSTAKAGSSQGIGLRAGYEMAFGPFAVQAGFLGRVTWWSLPDPQAAGLNHDVAWTAETLAYARASIYLGRIIPYMGLAAGLDTNYVYSGVLDMHNYSTGLGMNIESGLGVAITKKLAVDIGLDFHPATDTLNSMSKTPTSTEYTAMHLGAVLHL